jgi:signal transduction histidine kinase
MLMIDLIRGWLRARQAVVDFLLAVLCFALTVPFTMIFAYRQSTSVSLALVLLAVSCLPLLLRSRWPVQVAVATVAVDLAIFVAVSSVSPEPASVGFALYAVATRTDRRTAWRVGLISAGVLTAAALVCHPGLAELPNNLAYAPWAISAAAVGDAVRSHREVLAAALERAVRAERTREEEALRRVGEERIRIARDLHDVVAHHITLVNAQAGVAHHLMRSDTDTAYLALERIRDTSRTALDELRATVGLLRSSSEPDSPREPTPGLAGLDSLLDSFRHAGLRIVVDRGCPAGPLAEVTGLTDLAAYRIVQEALTNTRKHAGPTTARVALDLRADTLYITVEDDGGGAAGAGRGEGTGHGMIGMRERARAAGGTLIAGPRPAGGFRVHAELPTRAARQALL